MVKIASSSFQVYEGFTGTITWIGKAGETNYITDLNPSYYIITRDSTKVAEGTWYGHTFDPKDITVTIPDTLTPGTYVYVLTVYDTQGLSATSQNVNVNVVGVPTVTITGGAPPTDPPAIGVQYSDGFVAQNNWVRLTGITPGDEWKWRIDYWFDLDGDDANSCGAGDLCVIEGAVPSTGSGYVNMPAKSWSQIDFILPGGQEVGVWNAKARSWEEGESGYIYDTEVGGFSVSNELSHVYGFDKETDTGTEYYGSIDFNEKGEFLLQGWLYDDDTTIGNKAIRTDQVIEWWYCHEDDDCGVGTTGDWTKIGEDTVDSNGRAQYMWRFRPAEIWAPEENWYHDIWIKTVHPQTTAPVYYLSAEMVRRPPTLIYDRILISPEPTYTEDMGSIGGFWEDYARDCGIWGECTWGKSSDRSYDANSYSLVMYGDLTCGPGAVRLEWFDAANIYETDYDNGGVYNLGDKDYFFYALWRQYSFSNDNFYFIWEDDTHWYRIQTYESSLNGYIRFQWQNGGSVQSGSSQSLGGGYGGKWLKVEFSLEPTWDGGNENIYVVVKAKLGSYSVKTMTGVFSGGHGYSDDQRIQSRVGASVGNSYWDALYAGPIPKGVLMTGDEEITEWEVFNVANTKPSTSSMVKPDDYYMWETTIGQEDVEQVSHNRSYIEWPDQSTMNIDPHIISMDLGNDLWKVLQTVRVPLSAVEGAAKIVSIYDTIINGTLTVYESEHSFEIVNQTIIDMSLIGQVYDNSQVLHYAAYNLNFDSLTGDQQLAYIIQISYLNDLTDTGRYDQFNDYMLGYDVVGKINGYLDASGSDKIAIVVGLSEYDYVSLESIEAVKNDYMEQIEEFQNNGYHVFHLTNELINEGTLQWLSNIIDSYDTINTEVVLSWQGHSVRDDLLENNEGKLINVIKPNSQVSDSWYSYESKDGTSGEIEATQRVVLSNGKTITDNRLNEIFANLDSEKQFFILNTCYAEGITKEFDQRGRTLLAATDINTRLWVGILDNFTPFYAIFRDTWDWNQTIEDNYAVLITKMDPAPILTTHRLTEPNIITPNGDEVMYGVVLIDWDDVIDSWGYEVWYSLQYSTDSGESWSSITDKVKVSTYNWDTTSLSYGTDYLIRVTAYGGLSILSQVESERTFTIQNNPHSLTKPLINTPNGGEVFNDTINVQWSSSVDSWGYLVSYTIYYSSDNGTLWNTLVENLVDTSYDWDIELMTNGTQYLIKIVARNSYDALISEDISDGVFTIEIIDHTLSIPTLVSPNGGEVFSDTITIEWSKSEDSLGYDVSYIVYYSDNGGDKWNMIATDLSETSYDWDITDIGDGTNYMILVFAYNGDDIAVADASDDTFIIDKF